MLEASKDGENKVHTPSAKLTEDDVREIRRLGLTRTNVWIGQQYGVTAGNISHILLGRTWTHVK